MKDSRLSTILFNEWICLTSEFEKSLARLGRQVYQGFAHGKVHDEPSLELCRQISDAFKEAREAREKMEDDFREQQLGAFQAAEAEAEAQAENIKGDKKKELQASVSKAGRKAKYGLTKGLFRYFVNRELVSFRQRVQDLSKELAMRALTRYDIEPIMDIQAHHDLCQLTLKLEKDADDKWKEILENHKGKKESKQSFHLTLMQFSASFAEYARKTRLKPLFEKFLKVDFSKQQSTLKEMYEGSRVSEVIEEVETREREAEEKLEALENPGDQMAALERAFSAPVAAPPPAPSAPRLGQRPIPGSAPPTQEPVPAQPTAAGPPPTPPPAPPPAAPVPRPPDLRKSPPPRRRFGGERPPGEPRKRSGLVPPPPEPSLPAPSANASSSRVPPPPEPSLPGPKATKPPAAPPPPVSAPPPPPSRAPMPAMESGSLEIPAVAPPPELTPPARPSRPPLGARRVGPQAPAAPAEATTGKELPPPPKLDLELDFDN